MTTPTGHSDDELQQLREHVATRAFIDQALAQLFAPEDEAQRAALDSARDAGMPAIQISPLEGRLLQVLCAACGARKALEIGALAGYSSIWLARGLPADGRLISLELSEKHAAIARASLERAGVASRAEVRVGAALDMLPTLTSEAPFDLVFIDADKPGYPAYLEWAITLARPGSIIVADNCIRSGKPLRADASQSAEDDTRALAEYNRLITHDPRLRSVALPIDDGGTDGFAISVVLATA